MLSKWEYSYIVSHFNSDNIIANMYAITCIMPIFTSTTCIVHSKFGINLVLHSCYQLQALGKISMHGIMSWCIQDAQPHHVTNKYGSL